MAQVWQFHLKIKRTLPINLFQYMTQPGEPQSFPCYTLAHKLAAFVWPFSKCFFFKAFKFY